jgi:glycosyltransferase involved in cell wall biosynthesis
VAALHCHNIQVISIANFQAGLIASGEFFMPQNPKHVALVMVNLRPGLDGGATAMLELMPYVRRLGFKASIFNFVTGEPHHRALLATRMTGAGGAPLVCQEDFYQYREGEVDCHLWFLPYSIDDLRADRGPVLKYLIRTLGGLKVDYVLTADRISVLAVHLLGWPGCHFFHSLGNIQRMQGMHPAYLSSILTRQSAAVSSFLQGKVKELLGLDAALLHPGIDLETYRAPRSSPAEAIGFYASGYPDYKGDEVVAALIEQMPERTFVIVGRAFKHHFDTLPDNVTFLGFQHDMREFYRRLKVVLVPSVVPEGFPRIILEAAANGIPAIANNIGGIPEALGEGGILIDIDSSAKPDGQRLAACYATRIQRLFDNPGEYQSLSHKALHRARLYERELEDDLGLFFEHHLP